MTNDHRSRPRTNLRSPLFLFFPESNALIETETENVSMEGFFCQVTRLYAPGERFRFLLRLAPAAADQQAAKPVYLDGMAEVVHVRIGRSTQLFGIGCRIEGYRVLPESQVVGTDDIRTTLTVPFRAEPPNQGAIKQAALKSVARTAL